VAQSLPAAEAETTQVWNQYQAAHQQGATDNTDGLQIGHTQCYGMTWLSLMLHLLFMFEVAHN